jgi:hypothetical protein
MRVSAILAIVVALAAIPTGSDAGDKWYKTRCSCNNVTRFFEANYCYPDSQQARGCQLSAALCANPICPNSHPASPVRKSNGELDCTMLNWTCNSVGKTMIHEE